MLRSGAHRNFKTGELEMEPDWNVESLLSREGCDQAKKAVHVWYEVFKQCVIFFTSPLMRAQQTLFTIMRELGYKDRLERCFFIDTDLWTHEPEKYLFFDPDEPIINWINRDMGVAIDIGEDIYNYAIREVILPKIDEGETLLCISHRGPIDLLLAYCRKKLCDAEAYSNIRDLYNCEGFVLEFKDGQLSGIKELRFENQA